MNYNEMLSIVEQFENMGLLCDTGKRRNGKVLFRFGMPSPEKMDELFLYMQSEPAAYECLAAVGMACGMAPGEVSARISRLRKLSSKDD
jgi:hypothetical protein